MDWMDSGQTCLNSSCRLKMLCVNALARVSGELPPHVVEYSAIKSTYLQASRQTFRGFHHSRAETSQLAGVYCGSLHASRLFPDTVVYFPYLDA